MREINYGEPPLNPKNHKLWRVFLMIIGILVAVGIVLMLTGCGGGNFGGGSAVQQDAAATQQRQAAMRSEVGLPNIVNFTEAKFAKQISELRDQEIATWTYYLDINGRRHLLCESVGFGLPYSVQITSPEVISPGSEDSHGNATAIPQAEPNGLYMPDQADASWVLCSDGKGGVAPVYSEPHLLVSPFPLGHDEAAANSGRGESVSIEQLRPAQVGGASAAPPTP